MPKAVTNPEAMVRLGLAIRDRREALGLSQEAVSLDANIQRTYLSRLELGQQNPSYDVLLNLARALKISLKELLPE